MRRLVIAAVVVGVVAAGAGTVSAETRQATCLGFEVTIDMADLPAGDPAVGDAVDNNMDFLETLSES